MGIEHHDTTDNEVTADPAHAVVGVGVECAPVTPYEARVREFDLKRV